VTAIDMSHHPSPWHFAAKYPNQCVAEASRRGELEPCDKPAHALVIDCEDGHYWPVCNHHARGRKLVPLAELLEYHGDVRI
jgi:hypothetical protein